MENARAKPLTSWPSWVTMVALRFASSSTVGADALVRSRERATVTVSVVEGAIDGAVVGNAVGAGDGGTVGPGVGSGVGWEVGLGVGCTLRVGTRVGAWEGAQVASAPEHMVAKDPFQLRLVA
jgi:hypothetical protein